MNSLKELTGIQYSLALNIGQDLRLVHMLRKFLPGALRSLSCLEGSVWLTSPEAKDKSEPSLLSSIYSFPKQRNSDSETYAPIKAIMEQNAYGNWRDIQSGDSLPHGDTFYQCYRVGSLGLVLVRRKQPLAEGYVRGLAPIMQRLETACYACMQHEALIYSQAETIAAKEEAERSNHAKTKFLSTMGHEFRTPMNGILGMAHLALETELSKEQREYLTTLQSSANSLLQIIDEVLDISTLDSGNFELRPRVFNLLQTIDIALLPYSHRARDKGIEFIVKVTGELPGRVIADMTQFQKIITNLVGNAVKFTQTGSVNIHFEAVSMGVELTMLQIRVSDTGIGIPKELHGEIFSPFRQVDDSTHRRYGGTGLGLALSKKIINLMGGSLNLISKPGVGSTFTLSIPLATLAANKQSKNEADPQPCLKSFKVLLAEDNDINRRVATRILEKAGHKVLHACNGKEAVRCWQLDPPDVILMDMQMPEMDGIEATREIRALEVESHLPIIALTANARSSDKEACLESGMDHFLTKPINSQEILSAIGKYCADSDR